MSSSLVIKNIFTFANILSQAGTEVVGNWDESSLRNAFNWAKYCIQVEEETRNKSYREELDRYVRGLTLLLNPVCLTDLDLNKLRDANILLCKRLLQNPETPLSFVKHVSEIVGDTQVISQYRGYRKRAYHRKTHSKHLAVEAACSNDSLSESCLGQRVLDTLIDLCQLHTENEQSRFLKFVSKLTHTLLSEDNGMELVGHVLLAPVQDETEHTAAECVKTRILKALVNPSSLKCSVLSCEEGLLCQLSDSDDRFRRFYLNQLLTWASDMVPSYAITSDGNLYSWQYQGEEGQTAVFSFENLRRHVSGLLTHNRRLRSVVEPVLLEKRGQSYVNVWKDLLKGVRERSD